MFLCGRLSTVDCRLSTTLNIEWKNIENLIWPRAIVKVGARYYVFISHFFEKINRVLETIHDRS